MTPKKSKGEDDASVAAQATLDSDAVKALRKVLVAFTQASANALESRILDSSVATVEGYLKAQARDVEEGKTIGVDHLAARFTFGRLVSSQAISLVELVTKKSTSSVPGGENVRVRRPDFMSILGRRAADRARKIQADFVAKNVAKIGPICDAMPDVPDVSAGKSEISITTLTGEIVVVFADGSGFTARNGIVENVSAQGKPYTQFPLRFHDVTFPDGAKRKFASEEQMRDGFTLAG
jgi:hypothetical protein